MSQLLLQGLCCDKTTEMGQDEVYILVGGHHSNGTVYNYRLPGSNTHWDMNDGSGNDHCIFNVVLANFNLLVGESVEFVIFIMEEDGGMSQPYTDFISGVLASTSNPFGIAAGAVVGLLGTILNFHDSDDWIGTCAIKVENTGGQLQAQFRAVDRVHSEIANIHGPNTHEFRMDGDGSNYVGWYHIIN